LYKPFNVICYPVVVGPASKPYHSKSFLLVLRKA